MARTLLAWLDSQRLLPKALLPNITPGDINAVPTSALGVANGVPVLDANKRIPSSNLPVDGLVSPQQFSAVATDVAQLKAQVAAILATLNSNAGNGGTTAPPTTSIYNADGVAVTSFTVTPASSTAVPATINASWTIAKDPSKASVAFAEVGISVVADGASDSGAYDFGVSASVTLTASTQSFTGTRQIPDANGYTFTPYYKLVGSSTYVKFTALTERRTLTASSTSNTGSLGAPTNLKAEPGDQQINFSWGTPTTLGGKTIQSYRVSRSGDPAWSADYPATQFSQVLLYLSNGTKYDCTVCVVATDGTVGPVATIAATPQGVSTGGGTTTGGGAQPVAGVLTTSDSTVRRAREFTDHNGVSIHLTYGAYSDLAKFKTAMDYMGITHARDGFGTGRGSIISFIASQMPYLRLCMVLDPRDWPSGYSADQQVAELSGRGTTTSSLLPYLELVEGPNERDLAGAQAEAATYLKARITPFRNAGVKVASPSNADTNADSKYTSMGQMNVDYVTFHDYPGGDRMMNDTISRTKARNGRYIKPSPSNVPVISTEHGWATSTNGDAGKSMPPTGAFAHQHLRVYLECFKGLPGTVWNFRTYKYELKDQGTGDVESTFGFFDQSWNPKPAATAVRNMQTLLKDDAADALTFAPAALSGLTVTGGQGSTRWFQMQKANGEWWVALWEQQITSTGGNTVLTPAGANVTISWSGSRSASAYLPTSSQTATKTVTGTSIGLTSTFDPQLIRIA